MGLFIAEYDYGPDQDDDFDENCLPFKKGDSIFLKNKIDDYWAEGFNITDIISILTNKKGDGKFFL